MSIKAPTRQGLTCAQGIINLSEAGLLMVVFNSYREARSSLRHSSKKTYPNQRLLTLPDNFDWFGFSLNDVKWFEDRGCRLIKVDAAPGDLMIWELMNCALRLLAKKRGYQDDYLRYLHTR
jgi:hypothetical protein